MENGKGTLPTFVIRAKIEAKLDYTDEPWIAEVEFGINDPATPKHLLARGVIERVMASEQGMFRRQPNKGDDSEHVFIPFHRVQQFKITFPHIQLATTIPPRVQ